MEKLKAENKNMRLELDEARVEKQFME